MKTLMSKIAFCLIALLFTDNSPVFSQEVGKSLPAWQFGMLDLYHINTGRGDAAFYIFPDATTMVFDAGELDPTSPRTNSLRNSAIHPDSSLTAGEWVVAFIRNFMPENRAEGIDYALISHFHDDHFGQIYPGAKLSKNKKYYRTGITTVGDEIPIHTFIDRGYPTYDFPKDIKATLEAEITNNPRATAYLNTIQNYWNFIDYHTENSGMKAEKLIAGSHEQIKLVNNPEKFGHFKVQNIKVNGEIWNGKGKEVINYFERFGRVNEEVFPSENQSSLAIRIDYGPFKYYTGGDNPGLVDLGKPAWTDVETPIAQATGPVDIAVMDHHGNRDALNETFIKTLQPRVWIQQTWSSDHPGHEVLRRATSTFLYPGERDLFATNMLEANKLVIGPALENAYKSTNGHILVRVMPGGQEYFIIILNDENSAYEVKSVYGPYKSKTGSDF